MLSKKARIKIEALLTTRFIVGANYWKVPISHDILRNEYVIYNEEIEGVLVMEGTCYVFRHVEHLPSDKEATTVEWRTVDLLNHIHYSNTLKSQAVADLARAIKRKSLDIELLASLVDRYGNADAVQFFYEASNTSMM